MQMKVILSRKGFDSSYGGFPNPILPNGTMLSLPIPSKSKIAYSDLRTPQGGTYLDLMLQVKDKIKLKKGSVPLTPRIQCHLDPDLRASAYPREKGWKPLFGQAGAAQGHLKKEGVGEGDIFLFFGLYRKTVQKDGRIVFDKETSPVHVIYGYFEIQRVHTFPFEDLPGWMKYHPHTSKDSRADRHNAIYLASEKLSFNPGIPGAGTFDFRPSLVLTKPGYSASQWNLPSLFRKARITYHSGKSWKDGYFQSAYIGQEFVVSGCRKAEDWAKRLIDTNYGGMT
jgi:hypothetical protein